MSSILSYLTQKVYRKIYNMTFLGLNDQNIFDTRVLVDVFIMSYLLLLGIASMLSNPISVYIDNLLHKDDCFEVVTKWRKEK